MTLTALRTARVASGASAKFVARDTIIAGVSQPEIEPRKAISQQRDAEDHLSGQRSRHPRHAQATVRSEGNRVLGPGEFAAREMNGRT